MNRLVKATLNLEVKRKALGALLDQPLETRAEDFEGKLEVAKAEIVTAQDGQASAALAEPDAPEQRELTGEGSEIRQMMAKASFGQYVAASGARRGVSGLEAELNTALGMGELDFPMALLAPPETRAAIDGDANANVSNWLDRVFVDSAAAHVGVSMRSVPAGIAAFPVTTAGPTPQQRQRAEAATAVTLGVSVTELKPTRHVAHLVYSIEDVARLPGLAEAIRKDMGMALMESLDKVAFTGASAGGTEADISGFNTTSSLTETTLTQTAKISGSDTLQRFANMIDGKYSASPADLRIVAAQGANTLWLSTVHAATVENQTIAGFLRANGLSWTVRGGIESNTANGDFGAFIGLARGIDGAAVMPVWENGQLITDPYSGADKGEVALTLTALYNFAVVRTDNFKRLKFVT